MSGSTYARHYALQDIYLKVQAETAALGGHVSGIIEAAGAVAISCPPAGPHIRFLCATGDRIPSAPDTVSSRIEAEHGITLSHDGARIYLTAAGAFVELEPEAGSGRAVFRWTGKPDISQFVLVTASLSLLLQHRGLYVLHGAGLESPGGVGCLLVGDSGSGKSTLAFGLVHQGWKFLSDDALLMRRREATIEAIPFRRHFSLTTRSVQLFHDLAGLPLESPLFDSAKRKIPVDSLYADQQIAVSRPQVVIFPSIHSGPETQLEPVPKHETLTKLLVQTGFFGHGQRSTALRHLDVLKDLVNQALAYRLLAGQDLGRCPTLAANILEACLDG